jgi:iron complex outermembrane recepter protein
MPHPVRRIKTAQRPLILAIAAASACSWAQAQPQLEEVVVTAQKRVENLQDVPLSVAAVTGSKLDDAGIENLEDLTSLVPNIHLTQTGISTQLRIRGIGSDNSQGFEQSVATYKNGVYHSRAQLLRAPIFDMERVEIMRGPQSTLFGKNSIAGAIDLITARPTSDFKASVDTSYETEFGSKEITGVISGPLRENLQARLALRGHEDPGYFFNNSRQEDQARQEDATGRLSLDWQPLDHLDVKYTGEKNRFDVVGRNLEILVDKPNARGLTFAQFGALVGVTNSDSKADYVRQANAPEFSDNNVDSHSLVMDYELPSMTLSAVTGLVRYDYKENCDCDFSGLNIFQLALNEDYEQFSQEFRAASTSDGPLSWLTGIFYQTYDQTFSDQFALDSQSALFAAARAAGRPLPASFGNSGIFRDFSQSSDTWALFGQVSWKLQEDTQIIVGGRYTEESKDGKKTMDITHIDGSRITDPARIATVAYVYKTAFKVDTQQTPFAPRLNALGQPVINPATGRPFPLVENHKGHNLKQSRDESAFTPSVKVQHDFNDDTMGYISYAKGFKAGGFDPRSNNNTRFEFEEEKVDAFEVGLKTTLADGKVELNTALFRTDYANLQISQFDGAVGFNVGNAKDTQVQGLEIDGRWAMTEHISATYGLSLLDFEYRDFKNGNCNKGQIDTAAGIDTDADGKSDQCDYTGKRGVYTPKYTANAGLVYKRDIAGLTFTTGLDVQLVDEQQVHVNLDPEGAIDAYALVGLRFALEGEKWHVALLADNLTDEYVSSYMSNVPLSDTNIGSQTIYSLSRKPATYTLSAGLSF